MNICTASMPSLTMCIKAQRVLFAEGFSVSIVKLDSSVTRAGCAYGIEFSCEYKRSIKTILEGAKIFPTQYISSGGGKPL